MPKKYVKAQPEETTSNGTKGLPTDKPIAVYYRQSSQRQVGNMSTQMQTELLPEDMEKRGWPKSLVRLVDADKGVSGTKTIDERAGLSQIYDWILDGQI